MAMIDKLMEMVKQGGGAVGPPPAYYPMDYSNPPGVPGSVPAGGGEGYRLPPPSIDFGGGQVRIPEGKNWAGTIPGNNSVISIGGPGSGYPSGPGVSGEGGGAFNPPAYDFPKYGGPESIPGYDYNKMYYGTAGKPSSGKLPEGTDIPDEWWSVPHPNWNEGEAGPAGSPDYVRNPDIYADKVVDPDTGKVYTSKTDANGNKISAGWVARYHYFADKHPEQLNPAWEPVNMWYQKDDPNAIKKLQGIAAGTELVPGMAGGPGRGGTGWTPEAAKGQLKDWGIPEYPKSTQIAGNYPGKVATPAKTATNTAQGVNDEKFNKAQQLPDGNIRWYDYLKGKFVITTPADYYKINPPNQGYQPGYESYINRNP